MRWGLNVGSPVRRKIRLSSALVGCCSETNPSADMASVKPKWVVANRAEASTSGTLRLMAVAAIFTGSPDIVKQVLVEATLARLSSQASQP